MNKRTVTRSAVKSQRKKAKRRNPPKAHQIAKGGAVYEKRRPRG